MKLALVFVVFCAAESIAGVTWEIVEQDSPTARRFVFYADYQTIRVDEFDAQGELVLSEITEPQFDASEDTPRVRRIRLNPVTWTYRVCDAQCMGEEYTDEIKKLAVTHLRNAPDTPSLRLRDSQLTNVVDGMPCAIWLLEDEGRRIFEWCVTDRESIARKANYKHVNVPLHPASVVTEMLLYRSRAVVENWPLYRTPASISGWPIRIRDYRDLPSGRTFLMKNVAVARFPDSWDEPLSRHRWARISQHIAGELPACKLSRDVGPVENHIVKINSWTLPATGIRIGDQLVRDATLIVNRPDTTTVLLLSGAVAWNIKWTAGSRIAAVYASGSDVVRGLSKSVPIHVLDASADESCGDSLPQLDEFLVKRLEKVTGYPVTAVHESERPIIVIGDQVRDEVPLISEHGSNDDYEVRVSTESVDEALQSFVKRGYLRAIRSEEIRDWLQFDAARNGFERVKRTEDWPYSSRTYVVLGYISLPRGIGHKFAFFVPRGVRMPVTQDAAVVLKVDATCNLLRSCIWSSSR